MENSLAKNKSRIIENENDTHPAHREQTQAKQINGNGRCRWRRRRRGKKNEQFLTIRNPNRFIQRT